jgi:pimeloyl-ACP methyl ester carboxylesterase
MAYFVLALLVAGPEDMGPHAVGVWNAGSMTAGNYSVTVKVYYPMDAGGPWKPVALIHGGGANGDSYISLATILASHGLVIVVPTFGDFLANPVPQHGAAVNALLDWVIAQSGQNTPVAGRVDGSARGIAGHSNGGKTALFAAEQSNAIRAIVALDATDDTGDAIANAGQLAGPSFHLLTVHGCGAGGPQMYANSPAPKLRATVSNSSHCDINDQSLGALCNLVCGGNAWSAANNAEFRRYTVALLGCLLGDDPAPFQPWIDGMSYQQDVSSGELMDVAQSGLDQIRCGMVLPPPPDGGTPTIDASTPPPPDAASVPSPDAAAMSGASQPDAGCACTVGTPAPARGWILVVLAIVAGAGCNRRPPRHRRRC